MLHLLLSGVSLGHLESARLLDDLTLEHLKGLVGQFGTDAATHVAILLALVQMEHTDDTAVRVLGQFHELFHDDRRLRSIVDVSHEILDTVNDGNIRFDGTDGHIHQPLSLLIPMTAQVERVERRVVERLYPSQWQDTFLLNLLGRLLTLFSVNPQHFQRRLTGSFKRQHLPLCRRRAVRL